MSNRGYPDSFKIKVIAELRDRGDESIRSVAKRYNVSDSSVRRWEKDVDLMKAVEKMKEEARPTQTLTGEIGYTSEANLDLSEGKLKAPDDEEFCRLYVFGDHQFSAFHAYCRAYGSEPSNSKECKQIEYRAQELLSRPDVAIRISQLNSVILTDKKMADSQLSFLIMQNQDYKTKLKALHLWYLLHGELDGDGDREEAPAHRSNKYIKQLKGTDDSA